MGFKDLFFEKVPEQNNVTPDDFSDYTPVPVELDEVHTDTLIDDIYDQNELSDKSKSIFKIEELINSLPKEMVTDTKKTSVLATLGVFGLTVTDVTLDGDQRVDVLNSILSKLLEDGNTEISEKETEIENHKKEIAQLEKEISDRQAELKVSESEINNEVDRIKNLINFISGGDK